MGETFNSKTINIDLWHNLKTILNKAEKNVKQYQKDIYNTGQNGVKKAVHIYI